MFSPVTDIDAYNIKELKGQIMTFRESRKTKSIKKLDITFLFLSNRFGSKTTCFIFSSAT
jgi:hypothetical protein